METKKLGSWAYLQHTQEAGLGYHVTLFFFCIQYTVFWGCAIFFYPKRIMMIVLFHVN